MKGLVVADLHFNGGILKLKDLFRHKAKLDFILLCGDNAEVISNFYNHKRLFSLLREKFDCPIGFVAGNHDLWAKEYGITGKQVLEEIMPEIAQETKVTYLEKENLQMGKFTIAGTYGHYDYSLAKFSRGLTMEAIKNFCLILPGGRTFEWNDGKYIDWQGEEDKEICSRLINKLEDRIKNIDKNLIIVSHTVCDNLAVGHPEESIIQDFCSAYSGSTKLGQLIKKYNPIFNFCGHTHAKADINLGKTRVINIGAENKRLRYLMLEEKGNKWSIVKYEYNLHF